MTEQRPVIIKKVRKVEGGGHHGGAWKVAYADFATAMMAFFLMLWLLNATSDQQRAGLADYFDPTIPISAVSGGGDGMLGGQDMFTPSTLSGSVDRGVRPQTTAVDEGETLGERSASPARAPAQGITDRPRAGSLRAGASPRPAGDGQGETSGDIRQSASGNADAERRLADAIQAAGGADGDEAGHLRVRPVPDGLVIELVDLVDTALFAPGSARPEPVLAALIEIVAEAIAETTNPVAVIGHTDALPFQTGAAYTNWELSADRANASRRLLVAAGLAEGRITSVIGRAAAEPIGADPLAPENRRIAIKLLTTPR
ncbi:MAG: flagellar motor protein MotB [Pseudomonadota bacterium]